jgi:hypothetical protein
MHQGSNFFAINFNFDCNFFGSTNVIGDWYERGTAVISYVIWAYKDGICIRSLPPPWPSPRGCPTPTPWRNRTFFYHFSHGVRKIGGWPTPRGWRDRTFLHRGGHWARGGTYLKFSSLGEQTDFFDTLLTRYTFHTIWIRFNSKGLVFFCLESLKCQPSLAKALLGSRNNPPWRVMYVPEWGPSRVWWPGRHTCRGAPPP